MNPTSPEQTLTNIDRTLQAMLEEIKTQNQQLKAIHYSLAAVGKSDEKLLTALKRIYSAQL